MDGYMHLLSNNGRPYTTDKKRGVLVMYGLLVGNIYTMRGLIDAVMHEASGIDKLDCIIYTSFPSFRIPDAVLRYSFAHLKKYSDRFASIHFIDLPHLKKTVFHAVCQTLPKSLRSLVKITATNELPLYFGDVKITCDEKKQTPVIPSLEDVIFTFHGQKHGNGGQWGSRQWKSKIFHVSDTHIWYISKHDNRLASPKLPLQECRFIDDPHDNSVLTIETTDAQWNIKSIAESLDCLKFFLEKAALTRKSVEFSM